MTLPRLNFTSLSSEEICGDIVRSYQLAAQRLGYPTSYAPANIDPGAINILFFFWNIPWKSIAPFHPNCIVVNFEPMVEGSHSWNDNYLEVLKNAYLWEYSQSNFQRYRELGYRNADYVALGWEPDAAKIVPLSDVLPDSEQDIDVVFFGSFTQRRIDILDALTRRGLRLKTTRDRSWSLQERDNYLRRAKLVLNLHNWDDSRVVEMPRLSILLRHRKAVVCELYPDSEVAPSIREAVVGAPYDRLVDTIEALLADAPRRARLERDGLERASLPLSPPDVGPALERFLTWRAQQPDRITPAVMPRVTICMTIGDTPDDWQSSLQSWSRQRDVALELIVVVAGSRRDVAEAAARAGIQNVQLISMPVACDRPTARNIALAQAKGEYIVFSDAGDSAPVERLQRQAALLESCPGVDIVGCWCEAQAATLCFAQRHHEILTEYLGPAPLMLSACMIRREFLERSGVRHDPEFTVHDDRHMLCKCAVAGGQFSVIPELLHRPAAMGPPGDPARAASFDSRARVLMLRHLLPHCSSEALDQIAQLYAQWWPPQLDFAQRLLVTLAHACAMPASSVQPPVVEHEMLTRALRNGALRLLQVFFEAGLADKPWLEARFTDPEIARFLAPLANQLPVRPFRT